MAQFEAFVFCAAIGFAMAGVVASFYELLTRRPADFLLPNQTLATSGISILLSMFGGPVIVSRKILAGLRSREVRPQAAALGFLVSGMWSVCAGIFVLSLYIRM
ncbi:hypothetical protein SAMN05216548_102409 [Faunimonas pinastri]|uniref:Uncharacterized protein n=1 Tax=Faunimonas pinastri TaxID=1855383 RepID=A0A1H9DD99_9HYPH|nr:hypothetical protein [Faunimonas pinastri]SEQ10698.1 hypothetical protein SAMN05216548_102409 [Faunimonas pinastri]